MCWAFFPVRGATGSARRKDGRGGFVKRGFLVACWVVIMCSSSSCVTLAVCVSLCDSFWCCAESSEAPTRQLGTFSSSSLPFFFALSQPRPVITERERGLIQRASSLHLHLTQLQRQQKLLASENEQLLV